MASQEDKKLNKEGIVMKEDNSVCCPLFNPEQWNDKVIEWNNKRFIKDKILSFFYIPLNFGSVMKKLDKLVREAGGEMPQALCLSEHTSKWNIDLFLCVDKEIQGAENITMSGKFYSKVYEGDFKETGNWSKDFESTMTNKSYKSKRIFMWYTTCPKCAKKYGKNYVVIMAQIE